ncbi:hypothetical protein [Achromobacter sp. UMC46]|nr:hypothetical protein [Achromobacter sp. UMC46]
MSTHVLVAGIGMTPVRKPAQSPSYFELVSQLRGACVVTLYARH